MPLDADALLLFGTDGNYEDIVTASTSTIGEIARKYRARDVTIAHDAAEAEQIVSKSLAGYMTSSHGRHVAFPFYLDHIEGPATEDTGAVTGEILGAIATQTYEDL